MLNVSEVLGDVRNKPTAQALNFRLGLSGDTIVFQTSYKTDGTLDTKATLIVRGTSFASEEQFLSSRQVYAYDINKNLIPAVLTMTAGSAGGGETAQMVMVNEITTGLNADDDIVTYARGLSGGTEVEYIIPDVDPSASEDVQKTQQFVKNYVTEGCTGIFMINSLNEIVDIRTTDNSTGISDSSLGISSRFVIPHDVLEADATTYYGLKNSGGDVMHHWAIKGRVFTISGDIITVTTANTMEQMTVANTYYIRLAGPMSTYELSDKKNKYFEKSSTSKIRSSQDTVLDGSMVLLNVKDYMVNDVIVIN